MIRQRKIELLAPAKNLECGIAAVDHGADAIYIGAPRFGARAAAGNSLEDIAELVRYAHVYNVRIYVTVNTILKDEELKDTEKMIWDLYRAGVDALIVQDMGLLELNLPPIPLHASTQMDNRTPQKVRFLAEAGFRQVVLARELSLVEIGNIHHACPDVPLEVFVHGALCVSYSGQCYVSQACFGQDEDDKTWNAVIRQALIAGYLAKDIENYGLLKITEKGKEFMKKPVSFKITEDNEFEEEEEEVPVRGGASCAVDPVLYSMMKDLRKKLSKRLEVPPFVIFQDPSLEAMATTYPITLDELQNIPGVGAGKAKRYGKEFIELIKKHVEENEIERPEDLRVRTVANKSKLKVSIIQRIDRKVALDEIALTNGLEFTELLDEIEAIVYSGTRINIDYFLNDVMDEDHIEDIYEYFKDSETDGLEDAIEELGGDYTEEEIRLVRIKFLSEMAN